MKQICEERWTAEVEDLYAWPRVICMDPGQMSGVAVVWFDPEVLYSPGAPVTRAVLAWHASCLVDTEDRQAYRFLKMVAELGGTGLAVVVEDFILRSSVSDRSLLSPVRITAKVEYALWRGLTEIDGERRSRQIHLQSPADAKTVITDSRLKLWDMYTPGPDHARDATRHALLWCRRLKAMGEDLGARLHG